MTAPCAPSVVMLSVFHHRERRPAVFPFCAATLMSLKLSARKFASGRIEVPLDGASLIASALSRRQVDPAGHFLVRRNSAPVDRFETLRVYR